MKKIYFLKLISLIVFTFITVNVHSQIRFENGYYVDNDEQKIEGLIEDRGWIKPPEEIYYKSSENDVVKTLGASDITEFSIDGGSKYISQSAKVDTTYFKSVRILDERAEPYYEEKELFLKVLVEGEANLLEYFNGRYTQYYLKLKDSECIPLIYKRYRPIRYTASSGIDYINYKILENIAYQRQLFNTLQCESLNQKDFAKLDYKKKSLVKIFLKYNRCAETR